MTTMWRLPFVSSRMSTESARTVRCDTGFIMVPRVESSGWC